MCSNINNNGNEDDKHVSNFSSTVIHDGLHKMVNKNREKHRLDFRLALSLNE